MQQFNVKLWTCTGALAGACAMAVPSTSAAAEPPSAQESDDMFPGDFSRALSLMMMGEGGEGGIGMHRVWPTLSVPALTGEQIETALSGNSLTIAHHYTMQFSPDGKVNGYHLRYAELPLSQCPAQEVSGDAFLLHDGKCNSRTQVPWTGSWRTEGNQVCLDLSWTGDTLKNCYHMFFALDSVALVEPDGHLFGKAHKLRKGVAPDE